MSVSKKSRRMSESLGDCCGDHVEETGQPQLCREDEEAEQQQDGRPVDQPDHARRRQAGENDDRDRAEQRDARAVQFQARHMSQRDSEIGKRKDHDHPRRVVSRGDGGCGGHAKASDEEFRKRDAAVAAKTRSGASRKISTTESPRFSKRSFGDAMPRPCVGSATIRAIVSSDRFTALSRG
jgi:hypothetical protein